MQLRVSSAVTVCVCVAGPDGVCHRCVDLWSCHSQASTQRSVHIIGSRNESAVAQRPLNSARSVGQAA